MSDTHLVGEHGPEMVVLPAGAKVTPTAKPAFVVCTKSHVCPSFGDVSKGSRWHTDDPVVVAAPSNFKKEG